MYLKIPLNVVNVRFYNGDIVHHVYTITNLAVFKHLGATRRPADNDNSYTEGPKYA